MRRSGRRREPEPGERDGESARGECAGRGPQLTLRIRERRRVYETLLARNLRPLRFRFDHDGAKIVANFHRS